MADSIPSTFKIKQESNGEIKRFPVCNSFHQVMKNISDCWGYHSVLSYMDEDNDLIKVTNDADLHEAILVARDMGSRVLKFTAHIPSNQTTPLADKVLLCDPKTIQKINNVNLEKLQGLKKQIFPPKYLSMLNAGVPKRAVLQKMKLDGFDLGNSPQIMSNLRQVLRNGRVLSDAAGAFGSRGGSDKHSLKTRGYIPQVTKSTEGKMLPAVYNKMVRAGVPWQAVVQRMNCDGYDSSLLTRQHRVVVPSVDTGKEVTWRSIPWCKSSFTKTRLTPPTSSRAALCADIKKGACLRRASVNMHDSYKGGPTMKNAVALAATSPRAALCADIKKGASLRSSSSSSSHTRKSSPSSVLRPRRSRSLPNSLSEAIRNKTAAVVESVSKNSNKPMSPKRKQVSFAHVVANVIPTTTRATSSAPNSVTAVSATQVATEVTSSPFHSHQTSSSSIAAGTTPNTTTINPTAPPPPHHAEMVDWMEKLDALKAMGFTDQKQNLGLLMSFNGAVEPVINTLLGM